MELDGFAQKRLKREIDLRRKDIENLKVAISHHPSNLGWGQPGYMATHDDDSSDHGTGEAAESEMVIAPETNDTPLVSAMMQSPDPPPAEIQGPAMEVDDGHGEWSHNLQLTVLYMSLKLPHFVHYNVVPSLTSRIQLCCIQYRMRGYSLISRANYKLVSHV